MRITTVQKITSRAAASPSRPPRRRERLPWSGARRRATEAATAKVRRKKRKTTKASVRLTARKTRRGAWTRQFVRECCGIRYGSAVRDQARSQDTAAGRGADGGQGRGEGAEDGCTSAACERSAGAAAWTVCPEKRPGWMAAAIWFTGACRKSRKGFG